MLSSVVTVLLLVVVRPSLGIPPGATMRLLEEGYSLFWLGPRTPEILGPGPARPWSQVTPLAVRKACRAMRPRSQQRKRGYTDYLVDV